MHLHAVDVAHRVKTCARGMSAVLDLEAGVAIVLSAALTAFVMAAVPVADSAVEVLGWLLVLWCHPEVSRQCLAEGSHSCSQANWQMFVQALLAVLKRHTAPLVMLPSGGSALENVKYRLPSEASVACIGMNPVGPPASALQLAPPLVLR